MNLFDPSEYAYITKDASKDFQSFLSKESLKSLAAKGFYAETHPTLNLKVIAINTEVADLLNFYLMRDGRDPLKHLEWLVDELSASEKLG